MESFGNDDVSSPNAHKYLVGNDDVKAEGFRRSKPNFSFVLEFAGDRDKLRKLFEYYKIETI